MINLEIFVKIVETIIYLKEILPQFYDRMHTNRCTPEISSCPEIPWIYGVVCVTIGFILLTLAVAAALTWLVRKKCASSGYSVKNKAVPASDLIDMTHSIQEDKSVLHKETNLGTPVLHHGPTPSDSVIANPSAPPLDDDDDDGLYEELGEPKLRKHAYSIAQCYMRDEVKVPEALYTEVGSDGRMGRIMWDSGCETLNVEGANLPRPPSDFFTLE